LQIQFAGCSLLPLWDGRGSVLRPGAHSGFQLLLFALHGRRYDVVLAPVAGGSNPIRSSGSTSARGAVLRMLTDKACALLLDVRSPSHTGHRSTTYLFLTIDFGEVFKNRVELCGANVSRY
jgi:hypothetical protein